MKHSENPEKENTQKETRKDTMAKDSVFPELTEEKVMSLLRRTQPKNYLRTNATPLHYVRNLAVIPFRPIQKKVKKALLFYLKVICDSLRKSQPNAEKFYAGFYSKIVKNAPTYFEEFTPKAATLFSTKLTTSLLQSIKNSPGSDQCKKSKTTNQSHLSERELAGFQYLRGYKFRNWS